MYLTAEEKAALLEDVMIRPGLDDDVDFICDSWLNSYRLLSDRAFCLRATVRYYEHKLIEHILPRAQVFVVCNQRRRDQIFAYIVGEKYDGMTCIHYAYTKRKFRGMGFARALFNALENELHGEYGNKGTAKLYSHTTRVINQQKSRNRFNKFTEKLQRERFLYVPYLAFVGLPENWHGHRNPLHQLPRTGPLIPDKVDKGDPEGSRGRVRGAPDARPPEVEFKRPVYSDDERREHRRFRPLSGSDAGVDESDYEAYLDDENPDPFGPEFIPGDLRFEYQSASGRHSAGETAEQEE